MLYIRDVTVSSEHYSQIKRLPKLHISWCKTLQEMSEKKRFDRYVLSTRTDGIFEIRKTGKNSSTTKITNMHLDVCKNCLDKLQFEGYKFGQNKTSNQRIFKAFTLDKFFRQYPKSPLDSKPKPRYTSASAPTDVYSDDFKKISLRYRESHGWTCEECRINLARKDLRRYLHTHHCNGRKHDNSDKNLRALCIDCHARQPNHEVMKSIPDYIDFINKKSSNKEAIPNVANS